MKRSFSVEKIFVIIVILFLSIFSIIKNYNYMNSFKIEHENLQNEIKKCETNSENIDDSSYRDYCVRIKNIPNYKEDFFSTFSNILVFDFWFLNPFAFLLIVIPSIKYICNLFKYKFIINEVTRSDYKSFIKYILKRSYRYVWLLPLIAIIIMIPILFYTTLDPSYALYFGTSIWGADIITKPLLFFALYLINITIYSFSIINLALIVARKHHNYIKTIILSYILYIAIELFLEVVINELILKIIFNVKFGYLFNIMNFFTFNIQYGILNLLLFSLMFLFITFIILILKYRNKEKFIIDCEKNN